MPATMSMPPTISAIEIAVPRSGSTSTRPQAKAETAAIGTRSAIRSRRVAAGGEQRRAGAEQADLGELRRLEGERPEREPAPRAVDLDADARDQHRHQQAERDDEDQRAGDPQPGRAARA